MRHLTHGQRAWLESTLEQRQRALDRRLAEHHTGLSRAEHAHELLAQGSGNAAQRESEREVDLALSDRETQELGAVSQALLRLRAGEAGGYGVCRDCRAEIPFDRLLAEPEALRCVACETQRERA